jgi:NADH-quinone oxidoreductase subunit J
MTTRPRPIPFDRRLLPGLLAVALFAVMAATFLSLSFPDPEGFPSTSIVAAIGQSLIGLAEEGGVPGTENFLVALILIALVLDAALDGALMLATRDGGEDS